MSTKTSKAEVPKLELQDVHCSPPARPALRGVSLTISQGSFYAISGPNGAGKGTLCRCLARLWRESRGSILLDGSRIPNEPEDLPALGAIAVLQGAKVFPELTVMENLLSVPATWRSNRRRERLDFVLQLFPHLRDRLRQTGGTLSGGEQQMVAIGRALMAQPRLLVLEEPSMGLAAQATNEVYAALTQISHEGRTVVVTEETLTVAGRFATQACLMEQGNIVSVGSPQNVLNGISTRNAALFV